MNSRQDQTTYVKTSVIPQYGSGEFVHCPSAPRTNLLSSAARIFADRWFSVKAQILSVFSSLFGSPLLPRSKLMIYVFMSSLLYLNRKNFTDKNINHLLCLAVAFDLLLGLLLTILFVI